MKEKLLTLVIPTYNMEKYLEKCLDSLLVSDKELLKSLDVLIVNDGSKDGSSAIGHRYQDTYPDTFRVIDKENGNYGSCVNRGLKEATGKYIKILDADDWFDTNSLKEFLIFLSNTNADLVLSDFDFVTPEGEIHNTFRFHLQPGQHTLKDNNIVRDVWMHAVTYRRAIFDGLNYHQTEGISHTDIEWIFLPMTRVTEVASYPHVLYKYLWGREGQTMDPKVFMREISHEIQGWKVNQATWEETEKTGRGDAEEYLKYRLLIRADVIYSTNIRGCLIGYSNQDLKDFDTYVKSHNPQLYMDLDSKTIPGRKFRYIRCWRRWFHCRQWVLFLLKLENKLYYWYSKVHKE